MPVSVEVLTQETDQRAAWRLLNDCLDYDRFTWTEFTRKTTRDPGYREGLFLGAYDGSELVGAMVGSLRGQPPSAECNLKIFGVRRERRGAGVGSLLLKALEETVRKMGATSVDMRGNFLYFFPGLDPRYTPAVAFLLRRRFSRRGEVFNMRADLRASDFGTEVQEARLRQEGILIRRLSEDDRQGIEEFMLREFSQTWLMETLLAYESEPPTCHIAAVGARIEAFAACEACGEGWFGPMGTSPALRGKGIGRLLMYRCFRDLQARAYKEAVIPWVGPADFYAKFASAWIDRVFWQFKKPLE